MTVCSKVCQHGFCRGKSFRFISRSLSFSHFVHILCCCSLYSSFLPLPSFVPTVISSNHLIFCRALEASLSFLQNALTFVAPFRPLEKKNNNESEATTWSKYALVWPSDLAEPYSFASILIPGNYRRYKFGYRVTSESVEQSSNQSGHNLFLLRTSHARILQKTEKLSTCNHI